MSTKPTGKLKIFSGMSHVPSSSRQVDVFVAATSRTKAVEALREHGLRDSVSHVASHWYCIPKPETTANAADYARAIAEPGQVFANSRTWAKDFQPIPKYDPEAEQAKRIEARTSKKASGPTL